MLAEADKPESLLRFVVLPPMRQLIIAASEVGNSGSISPADWKQKFQL